MKISNPGDGKVTSLRFLGIIIITTTIASVEYRQHGVPSPEKIVMA
jgi:hypothetical protein